jgi:hypothetical protein
LPQRPPLSRRLHRPEGYGDVIDMKPASLKIRFSVKPGDVPATKAARRLHLTLEEFDDKLPALLARGFPPPDPTTGMFDLTAIDLWRASRFPHLTTLTRRDEAVDAREVASDRISRM